ncbi:50S ribosomal chloroplastic [Chlorella sorokiniana]|uniref:50S ribosomal chloroplastic n=1 Tax=Chlorella sorokiniana TaxID=3076 RepID=A0A2P6THU9_CHLSO|nr:50S ribosomal chloroplastic [Chlorella sorokiniana]|eukprot:PRW33874.1 50S ribosomal chloroplastic [Chlorella sorokiniana]
MSALATMQVAPARVASSFSGKQLQARCFVARPAARPVLAVVCQAAAAAAEAEQDRLRLFNLSPQPGSKKAKNRKGRGYGAGQGGSAGFGMRGQKSRSGSGIRPGFEGGQTPLYRRLPKLKGIAGGMGAGLPDFVVVNLAQLDAKFGEGDEVSLESLESKGVLNLSGREARLPLKVLGTGELSKKLVIKAAAFSESAKQKIEAAGGTAEELPQKPKWTRALAAAKAAAN